MTKPPFASFPRIRAGQDEEGERAQHEAVALVVSATSPSYVEVVVAPS